LAGLVARGQNRLDDSQREFDRALQLQPHAFDVIEAAVNLDVARGRSAAAADRINKALAGDSNSALLYNLLRQLYLSMKDFNASAQALGRASHPAPRWWMPHRDLALVKRGTNDMAGAVTEYQAALALAPTDPQLATEAASFLEQQGRLDDALGVYQVVYDK